jgi:hypothetical protein
MVVAKRRGAQQWRAVDLMTSVMQPCGQGMVGHVKKLLLPHIAFIASFFVVCCCLVVVRVLYVFG